MSIEAIQIVGGLGAFVVVYAILYRPVMSMLERRPSSGDDGEGASSEPAPDDGGRPMMSWLGDRLFLLTVVAVLLFDQLSKLLVRSNMRLHESWPEEGIFRFTYGTNTGTAFGLFPDQSILLIVTSVLAIGFIVFFYRSHAMPSRLLRASIGLLLGGTLGNLIDRLRAGAVVDFIDVGWWPVFNLADSSIVIGIALLVAVTVLSTDGERGQGSPRGADDSAG